MNKKKIKVGLLGKVVIAIVLGAILGLIVPEWIVRIGATFNELFGNLLSFCIPLIILGLVAPSIGELGKNAGRLLLITTAIAYASTLFAGFFAYFSCRTTYPFLLGNVQQVSADTENLGKEISPFFTVDIPPLMEVMTALVLAFLLGIGIAYIHGHTLRNALADFKNIIEKTITVVIIPLLPYYIFTIFLKLSYSGEIVTIGSLFAKVIIVIFILHILLLLIQFITAGTITKRNPFSLLRNMLPAYATALGTQSSAATIPVTLAQTIKNGVREEIANFTIPLCATIHLAGSTLKIVSCAIAIMMLQGMEIHLLQFVGFIFMLGITMVAAPGVPGGAIMAAIAVLQSILGFDNTAISLMIALYIAMDSFGTACNVTGDGAIAVVVDKIAGKNSENK